MSPSGLWWWVWGPFKYKTMLVSDLVCTLYMAMAFSVIIILGREHVLPSPRASARFLEIFRITRRLVRRLHLGWNVHQAGAVRRGLWNRPVVPHLPVRIILLFCVNQLARSLKTNCFSCVRSILGTPTELSWPGVTSLPQYKASFPRWDNCLGREKLGNKVPTDALDLIKVLLWDRMLVNFLCFSCLQDLILVLMPYRPWYRTCFCTTRPKGWVPGGRVNTLFSGTSTSPQCPRHWRNKARNLNSIFTVNTPSLIYSTKKLVSGIVRSGVCTHTYFFFRPVVWIRIDKWIRFGHLLTSGIHFLLHIYSS